MLEILHGHQEKIPAVFLILATTIAVLILCFGGEVTASWVQAVGSVAAIFSAIWLHEKLQRDTRKRIATSVARAIAAEIFGIMQRAETAKIADTYRGLATYIRANSVTPRQWTTFTPEAHYTAVFDGNVANLGELPTELLSDVTVYYALLKGTLDTLRNDAKTEIHLFDPEFIAKSADQRTYEIDQLLSDGQKLIERLHNV